MITISPLNDIELKRFFRKKQSPCRIEFICPKCDIIFVLSNYVVVARRVKPKNKKKPV